jgi:RNA polymerase sigma factor (sigma-70 family)
MGMGSDDADRLAGRYIDFFRISVGIVKNDDEARDIVQEAIIKTLGKENVDDVCKYCAMAVKNMSLNLIKGRKMFLPLNEEILSTDYEYERMLRIVGEKRDELPDRLREVVELHDEDDYTLKEVSEMTGASVSTVKRMLDKAHSILREKILAEL